MLMLQSVNSAWYKKDTVTKFNIEMLIIDQIHLTANKCIPKFIPNILILIPKAYVVIYLELTFLYKNSIYIFYYCAQVFSDPLLIFFKNGISSFIQV